MSPILCTFAAQSSKKKRMKVQMTALLIARCATGPQAQTKRSKASASAPLDAA